LARFDQGSGVALLFRHVGHPPVPWQFSQSRLSVFK
jgi:hypothetical protein